ncbi:MAG: SDR family NAD(P)-dependent oxidoreductase [Georgfuchsia sp.]
MSRTALVVGAAGGVGGALVKQLLEAGYHVIGTVLDDAEASRLKTQSPGVAEIIKLDLTDADSVANEIRKRVSAVDAVVVCAAIAPHGSLEIMPLADLRRTLEINTVSDLAIYQATMPLLRASKGRILFISSWAGKIGLPFLGHYVASKHALEGLGDVMRREAKKFGVKVILVEAVGIRTPMASSQKTAVALHRASLSPADAALYGDLYDNYSNLLDGGWENSVEPSAVAEIIVSALTVEHPAARYHACERAKYFCEVAKKPDAEIDNLIAKFWGS